jgi:glutamyl-Q tRNA(Asp) synthetase
VHITRFAPSPTGLLHLGHAFAAVTACQAADGGTFLLRIEDLDQGRSRSEFEVAIAEDLAWLGLSWQKPVLRQSARMQAYRTALSTLHAQGLLYPCFCTRKEIAAEVGRASAAPHQSAHGVYPGTCRALSAQDRDRRIARGEPYVTRLDAMKAVVQIAPLSFVEMGAGPAGEQGTIRVAPSLLDDIVLARKDVPVAYHLAVVVDDAYQGITLVTRGNDLFAATHAQRLLQGLLELPAPLYAHHRLILDDQGVKFSKRDHAVTLRHLREQGISRNEILRRLGITLL